MVTDHYLATEGSECSFSAEHSETGVERTPRKNAMIGNEYIVYHDPKHGKSKIYDVTAK